MKTSTEATINISQMPEDYFKALIEGRLSFEEARELYPGPEMTIIEYEPGELEDEEGEGGEDS